MTQEFGKGYSYSSLSRMMKFSQIFTFQNVATLSQKLSWSHFRELLPIEDTLQIEFYAQMSSLDKWSVRTLRNRIDSMLYERTALSKKPDELISYEIEKLKEGVVSAYNRKQKRLIAFDLKLGRFKAQYKGQMELYLKYLEKYEKEEDENSPLGVILCSDKNEEQIELLELENDIKRLS